MKKSHFVKVFFNLENSISGRTADSSPKLPPTEHRENSTFLREYGRDPSTIKALADLKGTVDPQLQRFINQDRIHVLSAFSKELSNSGFVMKLDPQKADVLVIEKFGKPFATFELQYNAGGVVDGALEVRVRNIGKTDVTSLYGLSEIQEYFASLKATKSTN